MIGMRIDGTQKIRANLRELQSVVSVKLTNAVVRDIGRYAVNWARAHQGFNNITFKATRSIRIEQSRGASGRFERSYAIVFGNRKAYYAKYLEFGTAYIRPRNTIGRTLRHLTSHGISLAARVSDRELRRARLK